MKGKIKDWIRKKLISLPFAISANIKTDQQTVKLIKTYLRSSDNAIDVGCHKGEILDEFIACAPAGKHFGFEPIPYLYAQLCIKYKNKSEIYPYALAAKEGTTTFNHVKSNPAYSGLIKRSYDKANEQDETITVEMRKLDDIIPPLHKVAFIKIDTEGGEYGVLLGAKEIIKKNKPIILFEFGLGASDHYGTTPKMMYDLLRKELGLSIYTLEDMLNKKQSLSGEEFSEIYHSRRSYIFVAAVNTLE
jgi:FkbM family methyltransferase